MTLPDKLLLSLRLRGHHSVRPPEVVAVFHRWIAERALEEVLIDVADYSHVPGGPGVVLIGNQHNYSVAERGQELDLTCLRKRTNSGENPLLKTLCQLLEACRLLREAFRDRALEPSIEAIQVSVFDRKATEHHPFRTDEFAWLVAEHLAAALGSRPQVSVASSNARPTVQAAWATPTAIGSLLERLRAHTAPAAAMPLITPTT
ncbi:MAG TPA: hypothetical protein VI197_11030 [Polyangiaceae bacterium]